MDRLEILEERVGKLEMEHRRLADGVAMNNSQTAEMYRFFTDHTPTLVEVSEAFRSVQGLIKVAEWAVKMGKIFGPIIVAVVVAYAIFKGVKL